MRKSFQICLLGMLVVLPACQQHDCVVNNSASSPLQIEATVANHGMSRTLVHADGKTSFTDGDQIGLFMSDVPQPIAWTLTGGVWQPERSLFWPNQTDAFDFFAYYPYESEAAEQTSVPMPDLSLQTGKVTDLGRYDFLTAHKQCMYSDNSGKVVFSGDAAFKHMYCLLMVTLVKEEGDAETTLNTAHFEGTDFFTKHIYNFDVPGMQKPDDASSVNALDLNLSEIIPEEGVQIAVLINPTQVEVDLDFSITYSRNGESLRASTTALGNRIFVGGNCYKYKIVIQKGKLVIEGSEITDWNTEENLGDIIVNDELVRE